MGWNETIQKMNAAIKADPLVKAVESARLADLMPRGIPISEMPEEFKDGRNVLVFGEYRMDADGYEVSDFPKWWGARYDLSDKIWLPLDPGAKSRYWINPTHFLPYPADPK